jgi:hypothetical protein
MTTSGIASNSARDGRQVPSVPVPDSNRYSGNLSPMPDPYPKSSVTPDKARASSKNR